MGSSAKGGFEELISQSRERTREATLGVLGISDAGLRRHISELMSADPGTEGAFHAPPLFEHTFGWQVGEQSLDELVGDLLHPKVFEALTKGNDPDYCFPPDMHPYRHQMDSWRALLADDPRSLVVTTGTGSGKTECFLVPILEDLARAREASGRPLVGVRALFLYPLNALINSQRDRLKAWIEAIGDGARFCLYNGNTKHTEAEVRVQQRENPAEVLSRELLRREPPPILMTNATMLEYMLVRQLDSPILERSREERSLRWIVLDEAHTYVGSQAAELSLLLRRVMEAFGAEANSVRFVATSATLSGDGARSDLASYLAKLAGIPVDRVTVVGGQREVPSIPRPEMNRALELADLRAIDEGEEISPNRFAALCASPIALALRTELTASGPPPDLTQLALIAGAQTADDKKRSLSVSETLGWLDLMTGTADGQGDPFVRLRVHVFQRMLHGLWSCVNPNCPDKGETLANWPFGTVYVSRRTRCTCNDPVFEVGFCDDCKKPHLFAEDIGGVLGQLNPFVDDEFSLLIDAAEGSEDDETETFDRPARRPLESVPCVIGAVASSDAYQTVNLDLVSGELGLIAPERGLSVNLCDIEPFTCAVCGFSGYAGSEALRKSYLGAPFYVSNAVPTVLEFCPEALRADTGGRSARELPAGGRKLITFTDSRQGTARMAVKMQQEAERSRLRGLVFSVLRDEAARSATSSTEEEGQTPESLRQRAEKFESIGEDALAASFRERAEQLASGRSAILSGPEIVWDRMAEELAGDNDISGSIRKYNQYAHPELFGGGGRSAESIARLLLAREYARRPKRENSTESLGLVRVGYRGLDTVTELPDYWSETPVQRGVSPERTPLTLDDWKDFLKVALDFLVRENTFLRLTDTQQRWMGSRFAPKTLLAPDSRDEAGSRVKHWPLASTKRRSRLVRLLSCGTGLDTDDVLSVDKMDTWLGAAWIALCDKKILTERGGARYAMDLTVLTFSLPTTGHVCPITHRILDTTFLGLTPYLPTSIVGPPPRCRRVDLPELAALRPAGGEADAVQAVRTQLRTDERVRALRAEGLWPDLADRVVEGGFYYRTAEHSAQQSQKRLGDYETMFKQGTVNVLNCSTTMEMGVDIGGISAVVMNNVPPHPANYLQRAGRAGRRSEPRAAAYTLCRDQPHDRRAYNNPTWPFVTAIPSPNITLESRPLVRRHVHSFLLARFLSDKAVDGTDRTQLTVQWFFGGESALASSFAGWMSACEKEVRAPLRALVKGTALERDSHRELVDSGIAAIGRFTERWTDEEQRLVKLESEHRGQPYGRALSKELSRHRDEFLLRDLTVRGFLPGYGFPTDVVTLKTYNLEDYQNKQLPSGAKREDNIFHYKEQPSRAMAVALREYAPGAQIVVDGRVYLSAGVSLHSYARGVKADSQVLDLVWRCSNCRSRGFLEKRYLHQSVECTGCGISVPRENRGTVLQPSGFVTDFFKPTTNDVTSQTYVEAQRPMVLLDSDKATEESFQDARCGFVRHGNEGDVFVHSAGVNGTGYAVCLRCGRAESMMADGSPPRSMPQDKMHRPLGGLTGGGADKICPPESIQYSILLGHRSRTDVLELLLRDPNTQQWLGDCVVADTIALALREAIADRLGINGTEIGFGHREDRDVETGAPRAVVQVHDAAAGGAGFVLAGIADLTGLLDAAAQKLNCPADCENICPTCLAGSDGRVERERLDRIATRRWLESSELLTFLQLPDELRQIADTARWPYSPERFLEDRVRGDAVELVVILRKQECDVVAFDSPELRRRAIELGQERGCRLSLLIPREVSLRDAQEDEIRLLVKLGVDVRVYESVEPGADQPRVRMQSIQADGVCCSLLSIGGDDAVSEAAWLDNVERETLATTTSFGRVAGTGIELAEPTQPPPSAELVEFVSELNGPVRGLANRFGDLLREKAPTFARTISDDPVVAARYEDRYLACPWNVILLAEFIQPLVDETLESFEIVAGKPEGHRGPPRDNHHDWHNGDDMKNATVLYLERPLGLEPSVELVHRRQVSHRRTLTLELVSGRVVILSFDQGMGYWWMDAPAGAKRFDFGASPLRQAREMDALCKSARIKNCAPAATDISIQMAER